MFGKGDKMDHKVLDVDASMQGDLTFRDPVNLCISGQFDGNLDTKGSLLISERASVKATIKGEEIVVAGIVKGDIVAQKDLRLLASAQIIGNIKTPSLSVEEGAIFQGHCEMTMAKSSNKSKNVLSLEEVAEYLEVDTSTIENWAHNGKIPAFKQGEKWHFDKPQIDAWVASEKVK